MEIGLLVVILLILAAEFVNGWTDAPNAIATVVGTRTLSPRRAVVMAAVFNLVGVLCGTAVAKTIGKDIIDPGAVNLTTIGSAMFALIVWSTAAARVGIPTSESHALVAGLAGAGIATAGTDVLVWKGWEKVLWGLGFSTFLGFTGGLLLMVLIYRTCRNVQRSRASRVFGWLQILSAAFMAFSHGLGDGQKFMGPLTLALVLGGVLPNMDTIPFWVIGTCAVVMFLGTSFGGWRILQTLGMRLTKLETHQGFAAEVGAASTISVASAFGIPLSTTHTISTSIMGVGATQGLRAVSWGVTKDLVIAWVLTFPACGGIAWLCVKIAHRLQGV